MCLQWWWSKKTLGSRDRVGKDSAKQLPDHQMDYQEVDDIDESEPGQAEMELSGWVVHPRKRQRWEILECNKRY